MKCNLCKMDMQIVGSKLVSDLQSTDVYAELDIQCVNPECLNKGKKNIERTKVEQ